MRKSMILLAFIAAAFTAGKAHAQEREDEPVEPCTTANAERVDIATLAVDFREWAGRCVRVRGLHLMEASSRNRLLVDRIAALDAEEPSARALVINYSSTAPHGAHRPAWEEIVGTFDSCVLHYEWIAQYRAQNPDRFIMLTGLCHYTRSHFIVPEQYLAIEGERATRIRRDEVPEDLHEFGVTEVTGDEDRPAVATLETYLAALAEEDFSAFLQLSDPGLAQNVDGQLALELESYHLDALGEQGQLFWELSNYWQEFAESRDPRLFELVYEYSQDSETDGVFCILREGHAPVDLPVRSEDLDYSPGRPYFCVDVGGWVTRGETVPSARATWSLTGFPEAAE